MYSTLLLSLALMVAPDTADCGDYDAKYVFEVQIRDILTAQDGHQHIRSLLGLVLQAENAPRNMVTDPAVCDVLLQYFILNAGELANSALLAEFGWQHAVMQFGDYRILFVAIRQQNGRIVGHPSYMLFFDTNNQFITSAEM